MPRSPARRLRPAGPLGIEHDRQADEIVIGWNNVIELLLPSSIFAGALIVIALWLCRRSNLVLVGVSVIALPAWSVIVIVPFSSSGAQRRRRGTTGPSLTATRHWLKDVAGRRLKACGGRWPKRRRHRLFQNV